MAATVTFGSVSSGSTGPRTVTLPTHATGDLLLLFGYQRASSTALTITTATGWTSIGNAENATSGAIRAWYKKAASASETNPVVNGLSSANVTMLAVAARVQGADADNPIDVTGTAASFAAPGSPFDVTVSATTTVGAVAQVFSMVGSVDDNTWANQTGGWTDPITANETGGTDASIAISHINKESAGSAGTITFRQTANGGDTGMSLRFAIRSYITPAVISGTTTMGAPTISAGSTVAPTVVSGSTTIGAPTVVSHATAQPGAAGVNFVRGEAVFDTGISGWAAESGASVSHDPAEGHTRLGSLKVIQTGGDTLSSRAYISQTHTLRAERIVVSFWIKTTAATVVKLQYFPTGGGTLVSVTQPTITAGQWEYIDADILNTDIDLRDVEFGIRLTTADTYWIDEFQVEYKSAQPGSAFAVNSAIVGATTIGTPDITAESGGTDATAEPSVVSGSTTIGAPTIEASATITPTVVSGTTTVGAPTFTSSVSITPSAVAGSTTIGAPTFTSSATLTPSVVTGSTTIGAPTVTSNATPTPTVVAGVTTIDAPTIDAQSGATVTPDTVLGVASIPTPTEIHTFTRPFGITTTTLTFS